MLIIPAIDIVCGRAVRLLQGDYGRKTEYGDPVTFARQFAAQGATHLHIVDLDGAKAKCPVNNDTIARIRKEVDLFIEVGGGIREETTVKRYIELGIDRIILGTSAVKDPDFCKRMLERYHDRIAVGVDARDGMVATEGWLETSNVNSFLFCKELIEFGMKYVIYTDISCDGAQAGPNLEAYRQLVKLSALNVIASGGISSLEDIKNLRDIGIYGAIIGKALYTGSIDLCAAINTA